MLGRLAAGAPWRVLAAAGLAFTVLGVLAAGTIDALSLNRYEAAGSESAAARAVLAERFGTGSANVAVLVTGTSGDVDDPAVAAAGSALTERLAARADVGDAWSYWSQGAPDTLAAEDGRHALVLAWLPGDADRVRSEVRPAIVAEVVAPVEAALTDYRDGVVDRLPLVVALIVAVTFVVLFLMTGSVVAPVKATVLNRLALSVMFGVLVWGFQEGALAPLLGFTPIGAIEPSIPILVFCVAYGLSMDYEVVLLARIKADFDRTGDVLGSVPRGIARSASLVTAAALVIAASVAVYAASGVTFLQQLGIGMALAVLVGATVIRGVLVPAAMRLAGRGNGWAPAPLRRLHRWIGLRDESPAHPARPAVRTH